jgi:m7GpppX diphosphatase
MLIHYQPSYYHFHLHVIHVGVEGLGGTIVGQCHLLEDVIANIEIDGDYYAKKSMCYTLSSFHPLYQDLCAEV